MPLDSQLSAREPEGSRPSGVLAWWCGPGRGATGGAVELVPLSAKGSAALYRAYGSLTEGEDDGTGVAVAAAVRAEQLHRLNQASSRRQRTRYKLGMAALVGSVVAVCITAFVVGNPHHSLTGASVDGGEGPVTGGTGAAGPDSSLAPALPSPALQAGDAPSPTEPAAAPSPPDEPRLKPCCYVIGAPGWDDHAPCMDICLVQFVPGHSVVVVPAGTGSSLYVWHGAGSPDVARAGAESCGLQVANGRPVVTEEQGEESAGLLTAVGAGSAGELGVATPGGGGNPQLDAVLDEAINLCQTLCRLQCGTGPGGSFPERDLWGVGRCLTDDVGGAGRFACDVAHCPRTDGDNSLANQCHFPTGVRNWVEVDTQCNLIRTSAQPAMPAVCPTAGSTCPPATQGLTLPL